MERIGGCRNGWALCLGDQDVSQLLPMGLNFDLEVSMSIHLLLCSQNLPRLHGPGVNDNTPLENISFFTIPRTRWARFSLYIKGCMLLSQVKAYNLRFRSKRFMGNPAVIYASTYAEAWEKVSDEAQDKAADQRRTSHWGSALAWCVRHRPNAGFFGHQLAVRLWTSKDHWMVSASAPLAFI